MCTTQGMTRLLASIYRELVLTQEHYYSACLYARVLLACGKYLYMHFYFSCIARVLNKNLRVFLKDILSPVQEHKCDCKTWM